MTETVPAITRKQSKMVYTAAALVSIIVSDRGGASINGLSIGDVSGGREIGWPSSG